ncbi:MAG: type II toxin-antitoxin system RelE/ParE family toxin [Myxococcales bacterium]|nr:type II toxin-antitoxin system RelE/ParE family toxin [Myxococcales bacterium]
MRVRTFSRARRDITAAAAWWKTNRPAAPQLFEEELTAALQQLQELPLSGRSGRDPRLGEFRRLPLLQTRYHLYYRVNQRKDQVEVLRLWHMSRHGVPSPR